MRNGTWSHALRGDDKRTFLDRIGWSRNVSVAILSTLAIPPVVATWYHCLVEPIYSRPASPSTSRLPSSLSPREVVELTALLVLPILGDQVSVEVTIPARKLDSAALSLMKGMQRNRDLNWY